VTEFNTWRRVALGLGSNLGDRLKYMQAAVDHILDRPTVVPVKVSQVYETEAVGGPEQPDYLNAVLVVDTTVTVAGLLNLAHDCEAAAGRIRGDRWGPRTLDVDVLAVDGVTSNDPALVLPHPRIAEREFVLRPWADADPNFVVVGTDTVQDLLARVKPSGVRVTDFRLEVRG
jgi:2-amino-4-hydroxy-6-hydroxymethyldihydropteridine diphosphokinase